MFVLVFADVGDYSDTEAVIRNNEQTDLLDPPVADVQVFTSFSYLAGTTDTIMITFIGNFAHSGPHVLNSAPLVEGERVDLTVQLDRKIGELRKIQLENYGHDGWLMSSLKCIMGDVSYTLNGERQWVDSLQSDAVRGFTDGLEPDVQEPVKVAPKLMWSVTEVRKMYSQVGSLDL